MSYVPVVLQEEHMCKLTSETFWGYILFQLIVSLVCVMLRKIQTLKPHSDFLDTLCLQPVPP